MPLEKSMRAKWVIRVLVHLNRISLSALLQTNSKENQTFLISSTSSNIVSIYTSLCHKSRVRLRVTCDFGLWRRRGEKRTRREALATSEILCFAWYQTTILVYLKFDTHTEQHMGTEYWCLRKDLYTVCHLLSRYNFGWSHGKEKLESGKLGKRFPVLLATHILQLAEWMNI
jgi:hypothetical protein